MPPTRGFEKAPKPVDPDKYVKPEEVERLLAVARVVDQRWKKLPALIVLGVPHWDTDRNPRGP